MPLPHPEKNRWQPLRCGLVDLFHYDYQEFHFRDGRLLLRGNNGSGKSKVLALTLPFLLDGRAVPSRVEPDGDPNKKMEWNLLMAGRYNERVGYSWLEFGRLGEAGEARFCTVGCGLKAVKGRPLESWFFVTPQRVGSELPLLENRRALSRDRLQERLAGGGALYREGKRFRQAVDEQLFRLGEERYRALIDLLIQLRQPQLSKRPDERALSRALTEALPPLDGTMLGEVAEAFRNLEEERAELEGLQGARQAVEGFRGHYRGYARSAARRRAERVRTAQAGFETCGNALRERQTAHARAEEEVAAAILEQERVGQGLVEGRERERALSEGPEMRDARTLEAAERRAVELAERERLATDERERAAGDEERHRRAGEEQEQKLERSRREVHNGAARMAEPARRLGIEAEHLALLGPLHLPDGDDGEPPTAAIEGSSRRHGELTKRRGEQIDHLAGLVRRVEEAERGREGCRLRWQEAQDRAEGLAGERLEAETAVAQEGEALVAAFLRHCATLREMRVADPDAVAGELEGWVDNPAGESPAGHALLHAYRHATERLAALKHEGEWERRETEAALGLLRDERGRLEAGEESLPPHPYTRAPGVREGRAGAPLWQLLEFRDEVAEGERAAIEAALEGAGLLDAWLEPGGRLLEPGRWDRLLLPSTPAAAPTLAERLRPAAEREGAAAGVGDDAVAAVLAALGWGERAEAGGTAWIDGTGRWRLGPLHGAWGKGRAEYLGRAAREAARKRRLHELAAEIAAAERRLAAAGQALAAIDERRARLDEERASAPAEQPLRAAHQRLVELSGRLERQRSEVERRHEALTEARRNLEARREECLLAAEELALPGEREALTECRRHLHDYTTAAAALWPTLRHHHDALRRRREIHRDRDEALARLRQRGEEAAAAGRDAREAAARAATLRQSVGATVAELERRIQAAKAELQRLTQRERALAEERLAAFGRSAEAKAAVENLTRELDRLGAERHEAVKGLAQLATLGLLHAAFPEMGRLERPEAWSDDSGVRLARSLEKQLQGVKKGEESWHELQQQLQLHLSELQGALSRYGHNVVGEPVDELTVVQVVFQGRPCGIEELAALLEREIAARVELLDGKERELLEKHLIEDVAGHLQGRIQEAEGAVARMNRELERRPTSTGMKLRLKWRGLKDGEEWEGRTAPVGLEEARTRLLRRDAELWSGEERGAVGRFLKTRIDDARAADDGGTLQEVLERALDYRRWHRFEVERWQSGQWRPAYGPASGGERALVVTIPLFAAASSHYSSAAPHAPRLVLLDEAFAGVDDDSRAKCLGLLAQFDMDVVMTSEREWGCYAEVPGLAIAQLTRHEEVDAVHVSHWWWDGRRRRRGDEPADFETAAGGQDEAAGRQDEML